MLFRTGLLCLLTIALSGCFILPPYRIQIQQGPAITNKMVAKIKPGMTQEQVKFVLGTPNIKDPYDAHNWYYIYTNQQDHQPMAQKTLVIHFDKSGKVSGISGDYAPPAKLQYQSKLNS